MGNPIDRLKHAITYGNIWPYILILASERDIYAYELPKLLERRFGFKPNKVMIYVVLYKLESDKYIKSAYKDRRKYYSLTAKGRRALIKAKIIFHDLIEQIDRVLK